LFLADSLTILLLLLAYDPNVVSRDKTYLTEPVTVGTKETISTTTQISSRNVEIKEVKVKKFTLEQATKAPKGTGCIFNPDARWRWVVNATPRLLYPQ
jgi:hypothetical protein